ncbi:MAG: hypothetical protein P8Z36_12380, partial [Gemmatimonadota bacterium]
FNRGSSLAGVATYLNALYYFTGGFLTLSLLSVAFGNFRRNGPATRAGGQAVTEAPSEVVEP